MKKGSTNCQRYVRKLLPRHGFKLSVICKTAYTCQFRVGLGWSLGRVRVNVRVTPQWSEQSKKAVEVHTGCKSLLFLVSKLCVLEQKYLNCEQYSLDVQGEDALKTHRFIQDLFDFIIVTSHLLEFLCQSSHCLSKKRTEKSKKERYIT